MKKNLIIAIVAVLLIGGGAAAFFLTREDNDKDSTNNSSQSNDQGSGDNNAPSFSPQATDNLSFAATMSGTNSDGTTYSGSIESDGKGNTKFSGTQGTETFETYFVGGVYYMCQGGECFKLTTPATTPVDNGQYEYTEEDFNTWKNTASYKGKQSCPAGTCDAWEVSDGGFNSTVYLDGNGRVSKLSGSSTEGTFEITYEYRDVTITAPANAQSFPGV